MHPPEFCHWLRGVLDTHADEGLNASQTAIIKKKLYTVFDHVVDPVRVDKPRPSPTTMVKC